MYAVRTSRGSQDQNGVEKESLKCLLSFSHDSPRDEDKEEDEEL